MMQWSLFLLILMGHCFFFTCHLYEYHFIEEKKTWGEAQNYCREKYTDLATVSNMTDMGRLLNFGKNQGEAWIGLYNQTIANRTWQWSLPGVEYDEHNANWSSREPNDKTFPENCAFIKNDLSWEDVSCKEESYFLCYSENLNNNKNFILIEEGKKWLEAQRYCRDHYTDLVSGPNQLQDSTLSTMIRLHNYLIIGLFRDTWKWSDGSSFSFRQWDDSFDDDQRGNKNCAFTTLNQSGKWKNDDCNSQKSFFCYNDNVILINESKTWVEALSYCRENHHDLVSITNLDEQRWVQERAKNANSLFVWLGLRYSCTLDFWFWVTDKEFCYNNWASDIKCDDCQMSVGMETGGRSQWFKQPDKEMFNFICFKNKAL